MTQCSRGYATVEAKLLFVNAGEHRVMKYLFAWIIGVPGILVFVWFMMNHC
jgi:hypothetical protein